MDSAQYYLQRKEEIRQKADKAWQKYYRACNFLGEEYILLNDRLKELQEELKEIEAKEQESKRQKEAEKNENPPSKPK